MVNFKNKKIYIDGKPIFILSGEMHYFRQPRENWQNLIDEAKKMGLNCISSYVPWILHEETEGDYCFEDNLDLGAFIDLCNENEMYFFVRPGPYIMAEMKKEGIPYWIFKKHKDAIPIGFDGASIPCNTVDYLQEGYLKECEKWYHKVMQIIVPRLQSKGGNIIGVQLDNEIGMLNWVTNHPVLNDHVLMLFVDYLLETYNANQLKTRYPFEMTHLEESYKKFRSPSEEYSIQFHMDFGKFMRVYYKEYVKKLKEFAINAGVNGVPFFINIHGTGEGRIFDFALGISQLYEAYNQEEGMISGTDVYLGEPTEGKYQDLYVINALTSCMNKKGNPLTSIEFECSDGPYCSLNGMRYHPSATSHKMLMCLSQNARMLSFYVFSGGVNYLLHNQEPDGNGRMAFTGELHGFNAPVQPDGTHNYSFDSISRTAKAIHALNDLIADSTQVVDNVSLGFIPDYFLTEALYKNSQSAKVVYDNLKRNRCAFQIDRVGRGLLSNHINFDGVDIQNEEPDKKKVLVLLSARYMAVSIQNKLVEFVKAGGRLLLYGELPEYDMEGKRCTILMTALELKNPKYLKNNPPSYFLTYETSGKFSDLSPAQNGSYAQCFEKDKESSDILMPFGEDVMCGMIKRLGNGKICAITCDYPFQTEFWMAIIKELDIKQTLKADYYRQGIYMSRTKSLDGQSLLYIINLDCVQKTVSIIAEETVLFEQFVLSEKVSVILPVNVKLSGCTIVKSTAEIVNSDEDSITFRRTQDEDEIEIITNRDIKDSSEYIVKDNESSKIIKLLRNERKEEVLVGFYGSI